MMAGVKHDQSLLGACNVIYAGATRKPALKKNVNRRKYQMRSSFVEFREYLSMERQIKGLSKMFEFIRYEM